MALDDELIQEEDKGKKKSSLTKILKPVIMGVLAITIAGGLSVLEYKKHLIYNFATSFITTSTPKSKTPTTPDYSLYDTNYSKYDKKTGSFQYNELKCDKSTSTKINNTYTGEQYCLGEKTK